MTKSTAVGYLGGVQTVVRIVKLLNGFIVAIGSRGVHALRIVCDTDDLCDWIGNPSEKPITKRLAVGKAVVSIRVGFDVSRYIVHLFEVLHVVFFLGIQLLSLGVAATSLSNNPPAKPPLFHQTALWYPTIP